MGLVAGNKTLIDNNW